VLFQQKNLRVIGKVYMQVDFVLTYRDFYFYFFVVLGLELRALHLPSKHSTSQATPPPLFAFVIFQVGSCPFFPGPGSTAASVPLPLA
jgi:hypothetical protein